MKQRKYKSLNVEHPILRQCDNFACDLLSFILGLNKSYKVLEPNSCKIRHLQIPDRHICFKRRPIAKFSPMLFLSSGNIWIKIAVWLDDYLVIVRTKISLTFCEYSHQIARHCWYR